MPLHGAVLIIGLYMYHRYNTRYRVVHLVSCCWIAIITNNYQYVPLLSGTHVPGSSIAVACVLVDAPSILAVSPADRIPSSAHTILYFSSHNTLLYSPLLGASAVYELTRYRCLVKRTYWYSYKIRVSVRVTAGPTQMPSHLSRSHGSMSKMPSVHGCNSHPHQGKESFHVFQIKIFNWQLGQFCRNWCVIRLSLALKLGTGHGTAIERTPRAP